MILEKEGLSPKAGLEVPAVLDVRKASRIADSIQGLSED